MDVSVNNAMRLKQLRILLVVWFWAWNNKGSTQNVPPKEKQFSQNLRTNDAIWRFKSPKTLWKLRLLLVLKYHFQGHGNTSVTPALWYIYSVTMGRGVMPKLSFQHRCGKNGITKCEKYCNDRGEILRPLQDKLRRRYSTGVFSSTKNESLGIQDDQIPS